MWLTTEGYRRARRPLLGLVGAAWTQKPSQDSRGERERADVALLAALDAAPTGHGIEHRRAVGGDVADALVLADRLPYVLAARRRGRCPSVETPRRARSCVQVRGCQQLVLLAGDGVDRRRVEPGEIRVALLGLQEQSLEKARPFALGEVALGSGDAGRVTGRRQWPTPCWLRMRNDSRPTSAACAGSPSNSSTPASSAPVAWSATTLHAASPTAAAMPTHLSCTGHTGSGAIGPLAARRSAASSATPGSPLYQEWIANRRRLLAIVAEMEVVSRQAVEILLADAASEPVPSSGGPSGPGRPTRRVTRTLAEALTQLADLVEPAAEAAQEWLESKQDEDREATAEARDQLLATLDRSADLVSTITRLARLLGSIPSRP